MINGSRESSRKIWVISDTHLRKGQILPDFFTKKISREDMILHLGDFITLEAVEHLRSLCQFDGVCGNMDSPDLRRLLKRNKIIEIDGFNIGLMHGRGGPDETIHNVQTEFNGKVDIALFGHTHHPHHSKDNGTLFFNPGSLTDGRGAPCSFGLLHLDESPWGEIIEV